MTSLLVLSPGRPAILEINGGRVYVTVHDEYYRRVYREYRQRLRLAHPDMTPTVRIPQPASVVPSHVLHVPGKGAVIRKGYTRSATTQVRRSNSSLFRSLMKSFTSWKEREASWYAQFNLEPPPWRS